MLRNFLILLVLALYLSPAIGTEYRTSYLAGFKVNDTFGFALGSDLALGINVTNEAGVITHLVGGQVCNGDGFCDGSSEFYYNGINKSIGFSGLSQISIPDFNKNVSIEITGNHLYIEQLDMYADRAWINITTKGRNGTLTVSA